MCRLACVEVPALPLQLLVADRPEWHGEAVVVVSEDKPQGRIVHANAKAMANHVWPGLRYSAALALMPKLRAGVVSEARIAAGSARLRAVLQRFSPTVDGDGLVQGGAWAGPSPAVFWLDASGLGLLYASLEAWAEGLLAEIQGIDLTATVVVGFDRFATYAAGKTLRAPDFAVFAAPEHEREAAAVVALRHFGPAFSAALEPLGVRTVAEFVRLPAGALVERFDPEVPALHRAARGCWDAPLRHAPLPEPARVRLALDHAESDATRLVFIVKRMLHPLLAALAARGEALATLIVTFKVRGGVREERLAPAVPTRDVEQLIALVRLRLDAMSARAPRDFVNAHPSRDTSKIAASVEPEGRASATALAEVEEIALVAESVRVTPEQMQAWVQAPARDLAAGARALARLRAEFGEAAVVYAAPQEAHLPEASFRLQRLHHLLSPSPRPSPGRSLVRRFFTEPPVIARGPRRAPGDGAARAAALTPQAVQRLGKGSPVAKIGPMEISGGWWRPARAPSKAPWARETRRSYFFVETDRGVLLWLYYDHPRARWFLQGEVQ